MRIAATSTLLAAVLALGGCGGLPDMDSFRAPDSATLFRPLSVTGLKDKTLGPVAAEDLVDANGRCAGAVVPAEANAGEAAGQGGVPLQEAGVPMIPSAIALEMTECDVVKRAGFPERVEIGSNERNERATTLTYTNGPRPGIYRFAEGRLKSMERAPEPPAPPKPVKPNKRPAKPRQAAVR